jgi:phosphoribosyl 1,2-cyclic phosphodiesterase/uncharacterized protein (DUF433 family)
MALRFTVLASGSAGNASLVETDGFGVLLDAGLGPRQLADRMKAAGLSWASVQAALLTHTHSDHWNDRTLAHLQKRRLPLYCHPDHHHILTTYAPAFAALCQAGLVRPFAPGEDISLAPGLRCRPLPIRHDGGATFAFRFTGQADLFGHGTTLAYAADLGCWDDDLADALAGVDLLALEFNHDIELEKSSGRGARLIARVLGDEGHLSNDQAAALVRAVLGRSPPGRLQHLVQLHLSQECNRPELAQEAARAVLAALNCPARVHTASQEAAGSTLHLNAADPVRKRRRTTGTIRRRRGSPTPDPWIPGLADADERKPPLRETRAPAPPIPAREPPPAKPPPEPVEEEAPGLDDDWSPFSGPSWVQKRPGGGDACVRDTRIAVWSLVAARNRGLSDSALLRAFAVPLTFADLRAAWEYCEEHPEEIDAAIRQNEAG